MNRRQICGLMCATSVMPALWPCRALAQKAGRVRKIGFLGVDPNAWNPWKTAFGERLRALGWVEGRNIVVEYRWAEGRSDRYGALAAEFVRLNVELVVTSGAAVPAVVKSAPTLPVVFAIAHDPVATGLVKNLARPGGNVTGLSTPPELASKRLQLLRETLPSVRRLAIMADVGFPFAAQEMNEVQAFAKNFGIDVLRMEIRKTGDIPPAFAELGGRADALYVVINELLNASRERITSLALQSRLPTIFGTRAWVSSGGLMSYGPNFSDLFRRAAEIVDMILRGAKPSDIPVEQPTRFELVLNQKTARALGIKFPRSILSQVHEVLE
jgi:putative ABC transport system substrate-binding protein